MANVSFCFSGYVQSYDMKTALDPVTRKEVDISMIPVPALIEKLKSGKLTINVAEAVKSGKGVECEVSDFARASEK